MEHFAPVKVKLRVRAIAGMCAMAGQMAEAVFFQPWDNIVPVVVRVDELTTGTASFIRNVYSYTGDFFQPAFPEQELVAFSLVQDNCNRTTQPGRVPSDFGIYPHALIAEQNRFDTADFYLFSSHNL